MHSEKAILPDPSDSERSFEHTSWRAKSFQLGVLEVSVGELVEGFMCSFV